MAVDGAAGFHDEVIDFPDELSVGLDFGDADKDAPLHAFFEVQNTTYFLPQ